MKMNVEKWTRCKRVPFMGYSVEAIVQNEPVNLDNVRWDASLHNLFIAHIGRRGEAEPVNDFQSNP